MSDIPNVYRKPLLTVTYPTLPLGFRQALPQRGAHGPPTPIGIYVYVLLHARGFSTWPYSALYT